MTFCFKDLLVDTEVLLVFGPNLQTLAVVVRITQKGIQFRNLNRGTDGENKTFWLPKKALLHPSADHSSGELLAIDVPRWITQRARGYDAVAMGLRPLRASAPSHMEARQ